MFEPKQAIDGRWDQGNEGRMARDHESTKRDKAEGGGSTNDKAEGARQGNAGGVHAFIATPAGRRKLSRRLTARRDAGAGAHEEEEQQPAAGGETDLGASGPVTHVSMVSD